MPSLVYSAIGFLISLAGAVVIAWPIIARTDTQISVATGTRLGFNPELREMFTKERNFARAGIGMVIVGSSLQFLAATL